MVIRQLVKLHVYKVYYTRNEVPLCVWWIKPILKCWIVSSYCFRDCTWLKPHYIFFYKKWLLSHFVRLNASPTPPSMLLGKFSCKIVNVFLQTYHYHIDIKWNVTTLIHDKNVIKFWRNLSKRFIQKF